MIFDATADNATVLSKSVFLLNNGQYCWLEYLKLFDSYVSRKRQAKCIVVGAEETRTCGYYLDISVNISSYKTIEKLKLAKLTLETLKNIRTLKQCSNFLNRREMLFKIAEKMRRFIPHPGRCSM